MPASRNFRVQETSERKMGSRSSSFHPVCGANGETKAERGRDSSKVTRPARVRDPDSPSPAWMPRAAETGWRRSEPAPRGAGAGWGRGTGPAQEPGCGEDPEGWGCRLQSVRQGSARRRSGTSSEQLPQPAVISAAHLGRAGRGPCGGTAAAPRRGGGRAPGCGRWRLTAGLPGMPSGAAAWGGAARPCNSSCCP